MNVLITTPSLNSVENVSGISSITRLLIQYNRGETYFPFILGKKDCDRRGFSWFLSVLKIPFRLCSFVRKHHIAAAHFNIGFEPRSLFRDIIPYLLLFHDNIPLCLHIHGGRYMARIPGNVFLRKIITLFLKKSSEIIVLSEVEAEYLQLQYPFLRDKTLNVVSNAVEVPDDKELEKNYEGVLTILYLGRIDRKKGLKIIAEALNELSIAKVPFLFYLCGVGPDKDWFMTLLDSDTCSSIIDMGLICGDEKTKILQLAHVFLLPSFFEGLPMALLESMGYAVCPVVSPIGSIPNVVKDGENGLFVANADSVVSAISLLNSDRTLLKMMAHSSRELVKSQYSITRYVNQINEVYSQF